jgi:2,5-furandicarboxylate decarboxylase 1
MRKDAIYYNLHMPGEHLAGGADALHRDRQALKIANVNVKDINVTLGSCVVLARGDLDQKGAGEGKNALLAALSVMVEARRRGRRRHRRRRPD